MQVCRGGSILYFNTPLFLLRPLAGYCNPQVIRIETMVNNVNTTLVLQDQPQGYIFLYFYKLLRALSVFRMVVESSLKLIYSIMCGKKFQIYGVHIPRKWIESSFYSCSLLPQNSPPSFYHHPRQREITDSPRQHLFKICFPQQHKRVEETNLLGQNSI